MNMTCKFIKFRSYCDSTLLLAHRVTSLPALLYDKQIHHGKTSKNYDTFFSGKHMTTDHI